MSRLKKFYFTEGSRGAVKFEFSQRVVMGQKVKLSPAAVIMKQNENRGI